MIRAVLKRLHPRVAVAVLAYVGIAVAWIYGVYDRDPEPPTAVFVLGLALLVAVHLGAGFLIGRPSLVLVVLLVALSLPAGARDGDEDKFPVVGAALLYWVIPALALLALGSAAGRRTRASRTRRASS